MASIDQKLKAILMTAGSEKLQSESRYHFSINDGESKIIPFYWQDLDTDGESYADLKLDTNWLAQRINWKSRCAGGYYNMSAFNEDANGALLGMTWLTLNRHNYDEFDAAIDIQTNIDNAKTAIISSIVQDTLKNDDISRQFVPHIKYVPLAAKQMHWEEGILPTGKKTAPITTPFAKCLIVSNLTPLTSSKVTIQVVQNFYEYSPGVTTSSRGVVEVSDEA